jgi:sugar/nucleoside kinase (ribokinase family)
MSTSNSRPRRSASAPAPAPARAVSAKARPIRRGILAGGNWIIDHVKIVDTYPAPERLANILGQSQGTGGSPYNVLLDLAKLGIDIPLSGAGLVGRDALGKLILEDCAAHGVETRFLRATAEASTSFTDVFTVQSSGQRTFFHCRGANALWDAKDLDFKKTKARLFHLGYLLLLDRLDAVAKDGSTLAAKLLAAAQAAGLKTCIDVVSESSDRFKAVVGPALKHADYAIMNEYEAGQITGFKVRPGEKLDTASLRHAAGAILQLGVRELVVIHFPEGCFARSRDGQDYWQSSLKVPAKAIAGTAGAGDAFCAGVLAGLHEGWEVPRSLLTGVCSAAMSLTDPTCTGGMKPLAQVLALAKKWGIRPPLEGSENSE